MAHFPAHHDHSPQRGRGGVSRYPGGAQLFGGNNVKCQTAFPFMCRVTSMWGRWTALSPTFSQALTEQPGRRGLSIVPGGCAVTPDWPEDKFILLSHETGSLPRLTSPQLFLFRILKELCHRSPELMLGNGAIQLPAPLYGTILVLIKADRKSVV